VANVLIVEIIDSLDRPIVSIPVATITIALAITLARAIAICIVISDRITLVLLLARSHFHRCHQHLQLWWIECPLGYPLQTPFHCQRQVLH